MVPRFHRLLLQKNRWDKSIRYSSSGISLTFQEFLYFKECKIIRIVGYGNNLNEWNAITEVVFHHK